MVLKATHIIYLFVSGSFFLKGEVYYSIQRYARSGIKHIKCLAGCLKHGCNKSTKIRGSLNAMAQQLLFLINSWSFRLFLQSIPSRDAHFYPSASLPHIALLAPHSCSTWWFLFKGLASASNLTLQIFLALYRL